MKSLLLILGVLLSASVSLAQDLSDFERKEHFMWGQPGTYERQQDILREETREVWRQMRMPMECRPAAYEISEALYKYNEDLRKHRDEIAKAKVSKALAVLSQQDRCFAQVAAFYGFWSVGYGLIDINSTLPFFIELFNRGKLVPIRGSAKIGNGQMLGAYQCQTSTIYFNPFRGPSDLANILTHELTHFIRDKFLFSDDLLPKAPRLTAIEYSIVDETLAVLSGTLTELDEDKKSRRDFDLSLFSEKGALVGSILAANRGIKEPGNYKIRPSYYLYNYMRVVGLWPKHEPYLRKIIKLVASVYAPKAKYRMDVLVSWLKHYDYSGENFWTGNQRMLWGWVANTKYKTMDNLFAGPSTICEKFVEQIRKGELRDYVGTQGPKNKSERPGGDGVRPGGDAVRPGTEEMKMDLSGIRLCRPPHPEL